ncbi:hypothetical protein [Methanospirillum hungatei]|jgi:hypothetical protein|uniref:hypothetical protein n=1 Tax=Methanospirillum hungatei TaxID=2203 RepID=UPI0003251569|nr:hypothetical protein [Methanospirillum hungatei]MBP9008313.1 hypothetical protein [Methanospirillum sp.]HOW05192.1 hypothetical protein [Methanospirillum hungatei]
MNISLLDKDNIRFAIGEEHEENRKFITERADATKPNESITSSGEPFSGREMERLPGTT